ncbi:SRPBCC family protein [Nocardiopsis composta]|uniref:Ligand-binding SRPBCC domain-containing protein n=1 Tax=Nocardiopsis composta TaxID=157465 RepID=A0A7W8QK58_9ACTN|nr:SRPBCC family protein [Nocardiopsis composta]MBB5431265.1 ligand-binding SRPBCC domain-containing protein [Nocardiopsis composta]
MPRFTVRTRCAAPPERVFRACLDPGLHAATMAAHRERVVAGPRGRPLEAGDTVAFEARHFGLRLRLTARVTAAEPPRWFADEQVAGPFRRWRHVHRFAPDGAGGTVMTDEVDFAAPLGPLGRIAEAVFLRRYMERLIRSRSSHLAALLADGDG